MRLWNKFEVIELQSINKESQQGFARYAAQMNGYQPDDHYKSKSDFFDRYLKEESKGRLLIYDRFLRKHLQKSMTILSTASGRAANELSLTQDGYQIVCSDLEHPDCLAATQKLFGEIDYQKINVLDPYEGPRYDAVISLSLIYNFDDQQLESYFENIARMMKEDAIFILDYVGSSDNFLSYLFHDVFLKMEAYFLASHQRLRHHQKSRVEKVFHGYRRTNQDIQRAAQKAGLTLVDYEEDGPLIDFYRSLVLCRLMKYKWVRGTLNMIGKKMPYVRMGCFKKAPR